MEKQKQFSTNIGGQAVIEGVMMRGKTMYSLAVRTTDGNIVIEKKDLKAKSSILRQTPVIRGMFAFVDSLIIGIGTITRSAELAGFEDSENEEPSKFEKFLNEKLGDKLDKIVLGISLLLSLALAFGLFIFLPTWIGSFTRDYVDTWARGIVEGFVRILIFLAYTWLISKMKDMRRVFEYHGAEHKTISCFEHHEELTTENVRKHSRYHKRCGTSFLLIVMLIGMIVFTLVRVDEVLIRMAYKIVLLPVIAGLSYEVIKWAGRRDNIFVKIISAPGMWLQHITTNEPDDKQIEVAIASMNAVLETEGKNGTF